MLRSGAFSVPEERGKNEGPPPRVKRNVGVMQGEGMIKGCYSHFKIVLRITSLIAQPKGQKRHF